MNQITPIINAYVALWVVLINFVFSVLVLVRTSRTATYVLFVLICISNMFWNFGDFMTFLTEDPNWYYFSRIGSSMLPALMFHFILTLVRSRPKRGNMDPASLCSFRGVRLHCPFGNVLSGEPMVHG